MNLGSKREPDSKDARRFVQYTGTLPAAPRSPEAGHSECTSSSRHGSRHVVTRTYRADRDMCAASERK